MHGRFGSLDRGYVLDAIDSTFVSSVGKYVDLFEEKIAEYLKQDLIKNSKIIEKGNIDLKELNKIINVLNKNLVLNKD